MVIPGTVAGVGKGKDPNRIRKAIQQLTDILNSLLLNGDIILTAPGQYQIVDAHNGTVTSVGSGTGLTGGPITTSGNLSIANTGVTAGNFTFSNISVNAQGQITSAANGSVHNGTVTSVGSGTGLTGGPITASGNLAIANTAVTAGSYSLANLTVNAQGQLTSAANGSLVVTDGTHNVAGVETFTFSGATVSGTSPTATISIASGGTVTSVGSGTGLTGGPITTSGNLAIANTAVTAGSYTNANLTVNAQGQLTAASNGSSSSGVTVSDGTNSVSGSTTLNFTGAAVTGSTPTANISISGGGGSINAWEHSFTKPTIAGVTQVNTTGFTSSDDTNGLFLWRSGSLSTSDNLSLCSLAVPVGGWSATVRIQSLWADDSFTMGGVHLYESSTGKIIVFGCQGANTGQRLVINYFNSTTSFNSQPKSPVAMTERPNWLRITYDGSANYTFWWGMDGYSWVQFGGNFSKTALFTTGANYAGFCLDPYTNSLIPGIKCMSLTVQ
jgi:hypothetical protein